MNNSSTYLKISQISRVVDSYELREIEILKIAPVTLQGSILSKMNINYAAIIIISTVAIIVVILLVVKNRKDKKEMEQSMKQDYEKPKKHPPDKY
jgi:hypothetical protein